MQLPEMFVSGTLQVVCTNRARGFMGQVNLDIGGFFTFDLVQGALKVQATHEQGGMRAVVVPESALAGLVRAEPSAAVDAALRNIGKALAACVGRLPGLPPEPVELQAMVDSASAVSALFGWGRLGLECWGPALAIVLESAPPLAHSDAAVAVFLEGLLGTLAEQELRCVPVGEQRYLIAHPSIAPAVSDLVKQGTRLPQIVARLTVGSES